MSITSAEITELDREEMIEELVRNTKTMARSQGEDEETIRIVGEQERDRLEDKPLEELRNMMAMNLF